MISLQTMRNHKNLKWPVYFFFGLIIISFVFFYGWNTSTFEGSQSQEFAKIRSESINPLQRWTMVTRTEMKMAEEQVMRQKAALLPSQIMQMINPDTLRGLAGTPELGEAAANLILVQRAAEKLGVQVTREDIKQFLQQTPGMTNAILQRYAQQMGYADPIDYINAMAQQWEDDRMRVLVGRVAHASLFELWQEFTLSNEKLTMQMAAYPVSGFEEQVVVTDADLNDYLEAQREEFRVPAQRQYLYVTQTRDALAEAIVPTDEQIQAYYEQHANDYKQMAAVRVDELMVPLAQDMPTTRAMALLESVRPVAQASNDWSSLSLQLKLENPGVSFLATRTAWLASDSTDRSLSYLERVLALKDDEVSTPLQEMSRMVLLRVAERRPEGVPPLTEVRDRVVNDYKQAQAAEQFDALADQWRALVDEHKTIQDFAKAAGLNDALTTKVEANAATIPGVGDLSIAADYLPRLKVSELSTVIQTSDLLAVLQVASETEAFDPPLADVRETVEQAVRAQKAVELARTTAEQNLEVVKGSGDFDQALADAPIKPFTTAPFTRVEPVQALGAPLIDFRREALGLDVGKLGMTAYGQDPEAPIGYAIWKVTKLEEPSRQEFAQQRYEFAQQYLQLQQLTVINEWTADLRDKADYQILVKTDE